MVCVGQCACVRAHGSQWRSCRGDSKHLSLVDGYPAIVIRTPLHLQPQPRRLPLLPLHNPADIKVLLRIRVLWEKPFHHIKPCLPILLRCDNVEAHRAKPARKGERETVQIPKREGLSELEREVVAGGGGVAIGREVVGCPTAFGGSIEDVLAVFGGTGRYPIEDEDRQAVESECVPVCGRVYGSEAYLTLTSPARMLTSVLPCGADGGVRVGATLMLMYASEGQGVGRGRCRTRYFTPLSSSENFPRFRFLRWTLTLCTFLHPRRLLILRQLTIDIPYTSLPDLGGAFPRRSHHKSEIKGIRRAAATMTA